ncbi:rhodanese-like domain-containing protein [Micromonospora sp. NPDC048930]|uniref:MBL fold metallo-hydrolase n=1 Tax=Micromonospora sp. NPDC048930 TaxID=3364261 RepID=UPI003717AFBD
MGRIDDQLTVLVDEGLGNSCYLLDLDDGHALAVDPPRDLRAVRRAARRRGLTVAYAADTHLHADFLSGAVQLAADDGATVLASAAGMRAFDHQGLVDGDEVDLGGLTLRALATPGHTDEHLSFLLLDGSTPVGVFSGGSLIVGAAARTDLLGAARTVELAHVQHASLRRLAALPDATALWPTHGAGSFCSAPPGAARTSTIGAEKATNPLLAAPDAETFARRLTGSLSTYPTYFTWLAELNRQGPEVIGGEPQLPGLAVDEVRAHMRDGAVVVDVRPVADVAAGHIPGAVSIALRPAFATWLGWVVDRATPIVIVRNADQPAADILWPVLNIGYTRIVGELAGGMTAWRTAGQPVATTALVAPAETGGRVLDIRQRDEYRAGHLPNALHIELGSLGRHTGDVGAGPVTVMCGHGERAMTAGRDGHREVSVLDGGAADWARATGGNLEQGA